MKLSDTALMVLGNAANREDRIAVAPPKLPAAARNAVFKSLIKQGLLDDMPATLPRDLMPLAWRQDDEGRHFVGRITDAGFRTLNLEPPTSAEIPATDAPTAPHVATDAEVAQNAAAVADAPDAASVAPTAAAAPPRTKTTLREAAHAVLDAWDDEENRTTDIIGALEAPMASLRALLAGPAPRVTANAPRKPREGTKQEQVLTMLRRAEGASGPQIAEATGWASHYADVRIMPMCVGKPTYWAGIAAKGAA